MPSRFGRAVLFGIFEYPRLANETREAVEDVALGCGRAELEGKGSWRDTRRDDRSSFDVCGVLLMCAVKC
jgi:hypothetical protein